MASISPENAAQDLLAHCLRGAPWPEELLSILLAGDTGHLLFRVVAERLADLFEPRLCDVYADLFSEVIARVTGEFHPDHLRDRYERIRRLRRFEGDPLAVREVFVLSRVTLGADIAVTSVLLDAARHAFPQARVVFAGPHKNYELFAASPGIHHLPIAYERGTLAQRFAVHIPLTAACGAPGAIVVDPDSRLTQLGLLPICLEQNYFFFESRAFGGDGREALSTLAARWAEQTFGVSGARPFVAPQAIESPTASVTVSLGVGENPAKRIGGAFEADLLRALALRGPVLIDKGAGGEEAARVECAVEAVRSTGAEIQTWNGSFSGFAAQIARSRLYAGYDSAGGHAAAALGIPMIGIFAGFPSERMFDRWQPSGPGQKRIVRADPPDPDIVWKKTQQALREIP